VFAADENLLNSTRSTDFITPKSQTSLLFRNAVLSLARQHPFARALVNSGRLSVPSILSSSSLNTPDADTFAGDMVPGAPMDDAPVQQDGQAQWLLDNVGSRFMALLYVSHPVNLDASTLAHCAALAQQAIPVQVLLISAQPGAAPGNLALLHDSAGRFAQRFDATPGTTYLIRPDQHVAARWRAFDVAQISAAVARATCQPA